MAEDNFDVYQGLKDRNPETGKFLFVETHRKFDKMARGFEKETIPISEDAYSDLLYKHRQNLIEETEGVEYEAGERPGYTAVSSDSLGDEAFKDIATRSSKIVDTMKGASSRSFTSTIDLLGSLSSSFYPKDSQLGIDQRKTWAGLSVASGDFRTGGINDAAEDFFKSDQSAEELEFLFIQILGEDELVRRENAPFLEKAEKGFNLINQTLFKLYPDSFRLVTMDSVVFISLFKDIQKYELQGNLNFPSHEYGRGMSAQGIISNLNQVISEGPYFAIREPVYFKDDDSGEIDKRVVRFVSVLTHESIHGGKALSDRFRFGTPHEIALELITDYSTFIAFNKSNVGIKEKGGNFDDWREKTSYYPFIKLALALKEENFFDQSALTDDEILKFGVEQDWSGFISKVDSMLADATPDKKLAFINEIDRRMLIGPDEYESLVKSQDLTFMQVGNAMLDFQKKVGTMPYFTIGIIIDNMAVYAPDIKDKSIVEQGEYFMGTRENPQISQERRNQKHDIIRKMLKERASHR